MVHVFAPAFVGNAEDEHDVLLRVGGAPTLSGFAPDESDDNVSHPRLHPRLRRRAR